MTLEAEDIVGMMELQDVKRQLESVMFAAADLSRVHTCSTEQSNMCSIAARQSQLEATVNSE